MSGLRVALDGPASSGKSSVGAAAAVRLGFRFLDTGMLYRAVTLLSVLRGIATTDEEALVALTDELTLAPDEQGNMRRVLVGDDDLTDLLHSPRVDVRVSAVSAVPAVRAALLRRQRDAAAAGRVILAGRDIGTVVLPDAQLKLWLEVSAEERAARRAADRGVRLDSSDGQRILADLQRRDHLDSTRKIAPLRIADDAVVVHSDGRSFDETVDQVVDIIRSYAERAEAETQA